MEAPTFPSGRRGATCWRSTVPYLDDAVRQLLQARRVGEQPGPVGEAADCGEGYDQKTVLPSSHRAWVSRQGRGCWGCPGPKSMAGWVPPGDQWGVVLGNLLGGNSTEV